jgi:hypothetical protein
MVKPRGLSFVDRTGQRYGRLVVISREPNQEYRSGPISRWLCQCDCGSRIVVLAPSLAKGAKGQGGTRSCGCLVKEKPIKHGKASSRIYRIWHGMVQRCTNKNIGSYQNYGARGITVCDAWRKFENFYADMGDPKPGLTLDRIDGTRGYEPGNCRWATMKEQGNNRYTNVFITYKGVKKTFAEWAEETGLGKPCLRNRLMSGWPIERAFETPKEPRAKRAA